MMFCYKKMQEKICPKVLSNAQFHEFVYVVKMYVVEIEQLFKLI